MTEDPEEGLYTCFMTFEADEETRDMFYMVMGSIAENFRGVHLIEFKDDTHFQETPLAVLEAAHNMKKMKSRLTDDQQRELEEFSRKLNDWTGDIEP